MNGIEFAKEIFYICEDIPEYDGNKDSYDEALRLDKGIADILAFTEDFLIESGIKDYHIRKGGCDVL